MKDFEGWEFEDYPMNFGQFMKQSCDSSSNPNINISILDIDGESNHNPVNCSANELFILRSLKPRDLKVFLRPGDD